MTVDDWVEVIFSRRRSLQASRNARNGGCDEDEGRWPCILWVEPANNIEDETLVGDMLNEVTKGVGHGLEAPAVVGDGQITLNEGAEPCVEEESTGLVVAEEL